MMRSWWKAAGGVFTAALLAIPAWSNTNTNPALPGTLNYVEGQASIGSQPVDSKSVGSAELNTGQVLTTGNGKAEILLTPGVFLRVDSNSAIRMDSPGIANTELTLQQGRAIVEVAEIKKANDIVIHEDNASTRLLKKGLYEFDANTGNVRVFDGKARVTVGDRDVNVGGGHMLAFNEPNLKAQGFDKKAAEQDEFYRWASLRSSYLAEANMDAARVYYAGAPGWYGPGWYWDPWFSAYTWIPGAGVLWSPFGFGFYSPFEIGYAPIFVPGYYHQVHRFGPGYRAPAVVARPGMAHGFARGGVGGLRGGGFHQGFHGGAGMHARSGRH